MPVKVLYHKMSETSKVGEILFLRFSLFTINSAESDGRGENALKRVLLGPKARELTSIDYLLVFVRNYTQRHN